MSTALQSTIPLILLQIGARILTFGLNQTLLRLSSPAVFGTASIQFETLSNTILFLSREGVRNALIRRGISESSTEKRIRNTAAIPILLFVPIAVILTVIYLKTIPSTGREKGFYTALIFYVIASLIEVAIEPYYVFAQREGNFGLRVRTEGQAIIFKAITTLAAISMFGDSWALRGFGLGQIAWALRLAWGYNRRYGGVVPLFAEPITIQVKKKKETKIEILPVIQSFDPSSLSLAKSLTRQSFVKQFLSEGDKILVSYISSLSQQGGYAVALNYGSLLARIVFQPIEESSRLHYSTHYTGTDTSNASCLRLLSLLTSFQFHLALPILCLVPPYIPSLLHLILGSKWSSSSSSILTAYVYHIPLLGLNGVLEAFVQAVSSEQEIESMSKYMALFSAIYVSSAYIFVKSLGFGPEVGLIAANSVNMICRIIYAFLFIGRWSRKEGDGRRIWGWKEIAPSMLTCITFLLSGFVVRYSESMGLVRHFAVGVGCGVTCLAILWLTEKSRLLKTMKALRGKTE